MEKAEDELVNVAIHRAAESFLPAVGDPGYRPLIKDVVNNIKTRQSLVLLGELLELVKYCQNKSRLNVPADHGTTSKDAAEDDLLHKNDLLRRRLNTLQEKA